MKKYFVLIIFLFLNLSSQVVYLHPSHQVYDFLKRMESMQIISGFRDAVRPISRKEIAKYIIDANKKNDLLTQVDKENIKFYLEEFYDELSIEAKNDSTLIERWHVVNYRSLDANVKVNFVGGYSVRKWGDEKVTRTRLNGLTTYGYLGNFVGAQLYFRDHQEGGSWLDAKKDLQNSQGQIQIRSTSQNIEYDFADAQLNFDFKNFVLSIAKMNNVWGAGENGNIILSTRAPSYPQIKLKIDLGDKATFTYVHAFLNSQLVDSVNSYITPYGNNSSIYRPVLRNKYLATHILEFTPINGIDIGLGESNVYGNRNPEILFLIPVMFFKAAEHYTVDLDNNQLFGTIDVNYFKNYNFYGTLFIDDFSVEDFMRDDRNINYIGYTLGTRFYDIGFKNTKLLFEYSKVNPWVYNHKYPDATYQSHNYDLGHWMGQNAKNILMKYSIEPKRNIRVSIIYEELTKGGKLPKDLQYGAPIKDGLYGPIIYKKNFGVEWNYEVFRDISLKGHLKLDTYKQDENIDGIFQYPRKSLNYKNKPDILFGFFYNIQ